MALVFNARLNVERTTVRATGPIRPNLAFKPFFSGIVVWKHAQKLNETDAFAIVFAKGFVCHDFLLNVILV